MKVSEKSIGMLWGLLLLLAGCQGVPTAMNSADYVSWIRMEESPWIQEKTIGDYHFEVFLHPKEFQLIRQHQGEQLTQGAWDSLRSAPMHYQYATIRIGSSDGTTPLLRKNTDSGLAYQTRVDYLAFKLQSKLSLRYGEEKIPCVLYHYERSYDLAPFVSCLVAFPVDAEPKDEVRIRLEDEHFGTGPLQFTFPAQRFLEHPTVKFSAHATTL